MQSSNNNNNNNNNNNIELEQQIVQQIDLQECKEMIEDFIKLYETPEEDYEQVFEIFKSYERQRSEQRRREEHMEKMLRDMTERVKQGERRINSKQQSSRLLERFAIVEREKRLAEEYWQKMEREARTLEETREDLQRRQRDLKKKRQDMDSLVTLEYPKLKSSLSLYANITRIAWAFEIKDKIQGRIAVGSNSSSSIGAGNVRKIEARHPRTEEERFALANKIWSICDESHDDIFD